jgi:hypothetical protein
VDDEQGKENRSCIASAKVKQSPGKKLAKIMTPVKRTPNKRESVEKSMEPSKLQVHIYSPVFMRNLPYITLWSL